jgi:hypothetical protein
MALQKLTFFCIFSCFCTIRSRVPWSFIWQPMGNWWQNCLLEISLVKEFTEHLVLVQIFKIHEIRTDRLKFLLIFVQGHSRYEICSKHDLNSLIPYISKRLIPNLNDLMMEKSQAFFAILTNISKISKSLPIFGIGSIFKFHTSLKLVPFQMSFMSRVLKALLHCFS